MKSLILLTLSLFLLSFVSAEVITDVNIADEIELTFYWNNTENLNVKSYGVGYTFNQSELEPLVQEKKEDWIFRNLTALEINKVLKNDSIIAGSLTLGNSTNQSGYLGRMTFKRLTNDSITLFPNINGITIRLENDTLLKTLENITFPAIEIEVEPEETETPTNSGGSSGGGSGGGSSSSRRETSRSKIWTATPYDLQVGFGSLLKVGDKIKFSLSIPHTIDIKEIVNKKVTLLIQSDPIFLTLGEYESKIVCLNGEGLEVSVYSISDEASIQIRETVCETEIIPEIDVEEEIEEIPQSDNRFPLFILLLTSVIITLLASVILYKIYHTKSHSDKLRDRKKEILLNEEVD